MKKQILSLSVASAIALAGAMPAYAEDEVECVEVQTRFALANCMVESAVAIAAAAASENGCAAGEWAIDVIVPEWYLAKLPVQGLAFVEGNGDFFELNGSSSAMLQNNVNCSITTTASGNSFDGKELTYSSGSGNFYVDAILEPGSSTLCITKALSSGDIALGGDDFDEANELDFSGSSEEISANGDLEIFSSQSGGSGGGGQGQGPGGGGGQDPVSLSAWTVEEQTKMPELGATLVEGFQLEATTGDLGGCQVKIKADVENLANLTAEGAGGLTISGTLSIGPDDD